MEQHIQAVIDIITHNNNLSEEDKAIVIAKLKETDKKIELIELERDHAEKVKRTKSILLEETIGELEQKRKAVEVQNRQLEIEFSLERIRTVAMEMNKADDVLGICKIMFTELRLLGIHDLRNALINFWDDANGELLDYDYSDFSGGNIARLPYNSHPTFEKFQHRIRSATDAFAELVVDEAELESWKERRRKSGEYEDTRLENISALYYYFYSIGVGALGISTFSPLMEDKLEIIKRFRNVFDLSYRRYVDIKNAEAQARDAQIEAALERVRSSSMAMHESNHLQEVIKVMADQFSTLGISFDTVTFLKVTSAGNWELWISTSEQPYPSKIHVPYFDHKLFTGMKNAADEGLDFFEALFDKEEKNSFFEYFFNNTEAKYVPEARKQFVLESPGYATSVFLTRNIWFSISNYAGKLYSQQENAVFKRFAQVFEQAYTRFLDLQRAESQAREAQVETALEKVRSRTLAMQSSGELADTAAVLFQQLIALGIEPNRLYLSIMREGSAEAECWITDEEGSKISQAYTTRLNDNPTLNKMYEGWKQQRRSVRINMEGDELKHYFQYLSSLGVPFNSGHEQKRRVQDIAYFNQGFIGMASPEEQPAETLQLLERFAYVFNLTLTRFNDLTIAEAHALQAEQDLAAIKEAKQNAEVALKKLRSTQDQLIQSEKMASLGELTAGIAHEIQNPLNFVNNFSEVSKELLDEMNEELEKGNTNDAKAIMKDVILNLEKINQHGKRADAIVKGMLQHSRTASAVKEPTDINKLADEYLHLAYQGLRAKESFNATLTTAYDERIGTVNVIPQDIGRAILNLITNAFYAVQQKQKEMPIDYAPTVSVTTKKHAALLDGDMGKVEIRVQDNGKGIPASIKEKIFQPFFSTKPTGQGTGLGLSLSYDIIVKGHGGELKMETKEGEFTTFIVKLPC